jgi:hypothetical protein
MLYVTSNKRICSTQALERKCANHDVTDRVQFGENGRAEVTQSFVSEEVKPIDTRSYSAEMDAAEL